LDRGGPALVVAPLKDEADAVTRRLAERGFPSNPAQIGALTCSVIPTLDMIIGIGGVGKAQFGVQAQHLLDGCRDTVLHPTLLICVGGAGQLSPDVTVGDVIVGTRTIEHDYRERFNPRPAPSYQSDSAALTGLEHAAAARELDFGVRFGPIASGDEDVVDPVRRAQLYAETEALCVAWEGSGAARAARFNNVGFVELRVVTDAADETAAASFHANLERVMPHIADLLAAWRLALSERGEPLGL
jgi:adenosylhomocysteine nucleosidase